MSAFSLLLAPPLVTVRLQRLQNAPLPLLRARIFGGMLSPAKFSAQDRSTSKLLRTF
jgi:hypothetical protein